MAFATVHSMIILQFLLVISLQLLNTCPTLVQIDQTFYHIYQFGASQADTGNLIRLSPLGASTAAAFPPYGETFFNMPTGRWSNGLLIVDYIAMSSKLFPIDNYVGRTNTSDKGVNFAVTGSTALNTSFFTERGMQVPLDNTPLSTQLIWFKNVLKTSCRSQTGIRMCKKAKEVSNIDGGDWRQRHQVCFQFQNTHLQRALASLKLEFPLALIQYADYYEAFDLILRRASLLGFNTTTLLKLCCGVGGPYNYNSTMFCGSPGVPLCTNPAQYIHWDGLHVTQEAYRRVAEILFPAIFI